MKKIAKKIFDFGKTHKLAVGLAIFAFFVFTFFILPRFRLWAAGPRGLYETAKVEKQDLAEVVSASGEVIAQNQVDLKFQTSGQLAWVGVKEGDRVEKWQAIASLDRRQLEKTLRKELNDYSNERWDFDQAHEDYEGLFITNAFRRILEKAQFDLDNTVIDVEIADLAIKLATLTTPISGIVTNAEVPIAGVNILSTTTAFTIADPSEMKFVANVDETDIWGVRIGQKATITLDSYLEKELEGTISQIAFASITTSGGGTAFPVDITLPENKDLQFKVGMNGDAEIIIAQEESILTIPVEALIEEDSQKLVKIIDGRNVKEVVVETGIESDTRIEILKGLVEGQTVITGEKRK